MNEADRRKLKGHHETLKGQQALLERFASEKKLVIDLSTFRILTGEISRIKAAFPDSLPPFVEREFYAGEFDDGGPHYTLAPIRTYLATAVAKLGTALEVTPAVDIPSMTVGREGVFFAGQYFDAVQRITGILAQAETTILIVDGYIDASLLELLSAKKPVVEVRMMTKSVSPSVKQLAIAFNKQYGKLSIRTSIAFHDRFVVIDDHEFYHFGASLKDAGRHGFMFSRIEEPRVIDVLRKEFAQEWDKAILAVAP